jgi:hypothetical protein
MSVHFDSSCIFYVIADLNLLWGNLSLLRNRHPQFGIFFSTCRAPQHTKRVG